MKQMNQKGQALAGLMVFLFLIYFALTLFLFFLHQEGMFRFEFGKEDLKAKELVFDRNRVLELFRREKLLEEQKKQLGLEKKLLDDLKKQLNIEKTALLEDRAFITEKMAEITEKFKGLSDEEEANLVRLSKLYSKMKANRVATIFKEVDEQTIAELLIRMQDKVSAKILGQIGVDDARRAAAISDIIQGKIKKEVFTDIA